MTINNTANKVVAAGNGVITTFNFSFVGVDASDIAVIYTDASGNETTLATSAYSLTLNAAPPGQIWGLGGTVTYPLTGSPIALGTTLTIVRTVPLLQKVALGNQGNEFPSAVETALDLLEMQLQQISELFQRAIVAPVVDPSAPLPLPPAAQRANQALVFDSLGNPIAGAIPGTGVISTAMQPVVDAATLALGRTAFGLGAMAVEGIGAGLQDDGSGNARVNSPITAVATSQGVHAANHLAVYAATGALTFTLDRANTLFNGFRFTVYALTAAITVVPNGSDNFFGQASGASLIIPKGSVGIFSTDAATTGTWYADVRGVSPVINLVTISGSSTYTPSVGLLYAVVEAQAPGGGGGGTSGTAGNISSGSGGQGGQYVRSVFSASQIGTSQSVTIGAIGTGGVGASNGGAGGDVLFGSLLAARGGAGGLVGAPATLPLGGNATQTGIGTLQIGGEAGGPAYTTTTITAFAAAAKGGGAHLGFGAPATTTGASSAASGAAGKSYGGGGAGGMINNSNTTASGGNGGPGLLIVTEYLAFAA